MKKFLMISAGILCGLVTFLFLGQGVATSVAANKPQPATAASMHSPQKKVTQNSIHSLLSSSTSNSLPCAADTAEAHKDIFGTCNHAAITVDSHLYKQ